MYESLNGRSPTYLAQKLLYCSHTRSLDQTRKRTWHFSMASAFCILSHLHETICALVLRILDFVTYFKFSHFYHEPPDQETGRPLPVYPTVNNLCLIPYKSNSMTWLGLSSIRRWYLVILCIQIARCGNYLKQAWELHFRHLISWMVLNELKLNHDKAEAMLI